MGGPNRQNKRFSDFLAEVDADEVPSPRPDPETSSKSRRAQGRKMDDSNQPLTVDEVKLDFHATSPSKNATQVLGERMVGSHRDDQYRLPQKPKWEFHWPFSWFTKGDKEIMAGSHHDDQYRQPQIPKGEFFEFIKKGKEFDKNFYEAVRSGRLEEVKKMLASNNALLYNRFTKFEENAIQVAVVAEQEKIVSELLDQEIDLELLKEENDYGETTLTLAAAKGRMRIVKMLVNKYDDLADVKNGQGQLPVVVAALYGHKDIVRYLYMWTLLENLFEGEKEDQSLNTGNKVQYQSMNNRFRLFKACIMAGIYDIALEVFKLGPGQCIEEIKKEKGTTLYPLALADLAKEKRNRFLAWVNDNISSSLPSWASAYLNANYAPLECGKYMDNHLPALKLLRRISKELSSLYKYDTETKVTVLGKPMLMAILQENEDFVKIATQDCPDVLWLEIDGLTLFDHAISKGLRKIYKFAFKRPETKLFATVRPDRDGNTLLHRAAKLSSSQSLGPALQMQIELQRFKEVEKMAPMCKGLVNNNNQTPQDLFVVEHKELKDQGRDWLKEIATSSSVVATLIVTIMFAAAFTAPGGYKEDTGIPTNLKSKYFTVYIISDAFSLSFSCTSAMIFLGIHTSLFREEDFLNKLPLALMSGLFTLFLSIATMLVAFGTALVIMLPEHFVWIPIPLLVLGSTPVCIYAILHVRIFIQVLCWTVLNPTN